MTLEYKPGMVIMTINEIEMYAVARYTRCGNPRCSACNHADGNKHKSHGPYWYGWYIKDGRTVTHYIGRNLP